MVRTMSAKLRRSFAQTAKIGSMAKQALLSMIVAAPAQSAVLLGLALAISLIAPILNPETLQLFSAATIMTAAYAGYVVLSRPDGEEPSSDLFTSSTPHTSATANRLLRTHGCAPSDAEQLARLKARVSHELRTPLNAVIGFSEMMHHEVLGPVGNERYREYVAQIRRSAEHFQEATEKTLAVTELLASPPTQRREAIRLDDLISSSLHEATTQAWSFHIEEATVIEGDRDTLSDAFQHLWSAGHQFAAASGQTAPGTCSVRCERSDFGHIDVRLRIDNCDKNLLEGDSELSPGAELSLLLARLGIEAAGGSLTFEVHAFQAWVAVVRLPLAAQRELQLH